MPARRLAIAAALALACAPRRPPADLSLDPGRLLEQVRATAASVRTVRGEARVGVKAPGASGTVPAFVAAERPDRLHVETLDFFGNPVAVLVAAGGRLGLYDARERVFYRGDASAENVARLVPLPIPPEELVDVLCGAPPLLRGAAVRADAGRGFVTLVLEDGARTQSLRVGPGALVRRSEIRGEGPGPPGTYDVRFGDPFPLDGRRFPMEATIVSPEKGVRLDLSWKDVEPNAALEAALFRLEPPRGARVVDLEPGAPVPPLPFVPPSSP
jgi:hypothetical protein